LTGGQSDHVVETDACALDDGVPVTSFKNLRAVARDGHTGGGVQTWRRYSRKCDGMTTPAVTPAVSLLLAAQSNRSNTPCPAASHICSPLKSVNAPVYGETIRTCFGDWRNCGAQCFERRKSLLTIIT